MDEQSRHYNRRIGQQRNFGKMSEKNPLKSNECTGYDTAADFCEDHGGKLPSILSKEENNILSCISTYGFWSGHEKVNGSWRWLDGNKSNLTFWKSGHPGINGRHIKVNKDGEWVSVSDGECAEAICIIRAEDEGERRCADPKGPSNERRATALLKSSKHTNYETKATASLNAAVHPQPFLSVEHSKRCLPSFSGETDATRSIAVAERYGRWHYCLFDVKVKGRKAASLEESRKYCYHTFHGRFLSIGSVREFIFLHGVLYKELEDRRPNVVIAPVERNFLRHLADANLKKTSVEKKGNWWSADKYCRTWHRGLLGTFYKVSDSARVLRTDNKEYYYLGASFNYSANDYYFDDGRHLLTSGLDSANNQSCLAQLKDSVVFVDCQILFTNEKSIERFACKKYFDTEEDYGGQIEELLSFEDSERHCETIESTLASFSSEQEFKMIQEKYASKKYWIGLKQINENWEWMDTTAVDYTVWKKYNLTDEEFSVQKCMFVDGTGSWGRENCDFHTEVSWIVAQKMCAEYGSNLAWITSNDEQAFLEEFTDLKPFWLSLVFNTDKWILPIAESPDFVNWKPGELDKCCSDEQISAAYNAPEGWRHAPPFFKAAAVCKYESEF
ncbi:unnamed protein product [Enterobius vermicularis]|uniref:C-type lectin domain-containing protein n=1 Tax=Enterobius vermicularis TaxID=51028 RepID=A0A158QA44_ENTVE|nr:unnamed protein product [Enterobius vermicularis]